MLPVVANPPARYTQAIANTTNLNPGVQLERHDTAIALLCINKQIYLEAWPCLLHELLVFCVTADRATHDFLRSSFDPPHQLQSERRLLASPTAHPFTTIKSLRIGDFANLKHGRHSITHKMQQIRMLSTIKYSMPQLQHLALEVQYPSGMWVQSTLKNRLWYLESLSQLHVLKTFRFGCFNTKEYIAVYKKDSPMDTQRKLAVSCRSVLSGLVTASPKISHDNLQNWQALGRQVSPTVNTGEEAWKVIKNEMQTGSWGYTRASARLLLPRFSYN